MAPLNRIIIDTDPGVDDILAMLLAFSAKPEELEVLLISVTFGNVDVQNCLRNVISMFHTIEKEQVWRRKNGHAPGFETLGMFKPIVAVGAEEPLADQLMMADYFHGADGLGGIHESHPHLTPAQTWQSLLEAAKTSESTPMDEAAEALVDFSRHPKSLFSPSETPAHQEILRLLRENEKDTITIVAIGPLTNIALAAAADPETFLRVKEVVVMGGTIGTPGNVRQPPPPIHPPLFSPPPPRFQLTKAPQTSLRTSLNIRNQITPVAEFNTYADSIAAARVYALTSPHPNSTMPPAPPAPPGKQADDPPPPFLANYPDRLSCQLPVTLFPLDITTSHLLTRGQFRETVAPLLDAGSPLAEWVAAFLSSTFGKIESLSARAAGDRVGLALHDPLCVWYMLTRREPAWTLTPHGPEDIRVETSGQWTRGMCVVDRRNRRRREDDGEGGEVPGDTGNWLGKGSGNRVGRVVGTPGEDKFGAYLLHRIFG
ncbi:putative nucleoside hydrolase [Cryomyces antarcticus]|nr:hypothetical protein LTR04_001590 [Oleoguttula sp. CCFEE 6159]